MLNYMRASSEVKEAIKQPKSLHHAFAQPALDDLKRKSVVGGVAAVSAQGVRFVVQTATMMVLARLLSPEDFGLQGMVVAVTGFLGLFRDAGLGSATVQRLEVTHEQTSTLFWINVAVGAMLAALCVALAPLVVRFYHEPRLYWIAVVSGATFLLNGLAAQHGALLRRGMRFVTQAKIDVLSLTVGSATGIVMALLGCRYWSLVGMAMAISIVSAAAYGSRFPGFRAHRGAGPVSGRCSILEAWPPVTASLYSWRGTRRKSSSVVFGDLTALGLYGRAFQLVTLPVEQLNGALGNVAFPALSRIQHDAKRLARSFLRGFSLLISLTVPIAIVCALFAEEIIRVVLGAKWMEAAPIFRLLAPVALVFAVANPLSWLVMSTGRAARALSISVATTPFVIVGILLGLSYGPRGVALGYSSAMTLVLVPIAAWSKHGTGITWADLWRAAKPPFLSGLFAAAAGLLVKLTLGGRLPPIPYLMVGLSLVLGIYAWVLLIVMRQKHVYMDLLSQLLPRREAHHERTPDRPADPYESYKPND